MGSRDTVWGASMLLLLCVFSAAVPADMFDSIGDMLDRIDVFQGLQVTGRGDLTLRKDFTSGSREAYESQFWNTDTMQMTTSLDVTGPIWKKFGIRAHFADSGYGYTDNRYMLGWQSKHTALLWGDLSIRIAGNEFATYTKSLEGWQFDQRIGGNFLLRSFTSQEKGLVRRQTIAGNNTSGPYFLTFTPIVEGTELVKVDEEPMTFGEDYTLDYDTGQLYFEPPGKPPRIIPSTSTISVSYQSATNYEVGGTTWGAQLEGTLLGGNLDVYVTRLEHKTGMGSSRDTAKYQEDLFAGSGSTGPFDVRFSPILADGAKAIIHGKEQIIRKALTVLVDQSEQTEGEDYEALRQIGRIWFLRVVPPTAVVRIQYYYQIGDDNRGLGDSALTGLALRHRINDALSWDMALARSDEEAGVPAGLALSTSARYSRGSKFDINVQYRDIDPTFRYIDTVGFFRKEKGLNAALGWRPTEHIQFSHQFSDVKTDTGYSYGYSGYTGGIGFDDYYGLEGPAENGDETTPSLNIRARRNNSTLSINYPGWPSLRISRQTMENSGGTYGDSTLENLSFNLDYSPEKLPMTFRAALTTTDQQYAGLEDADPTDPYAKARSSSTRSLTLAGSWTPSDRLSLATNYSSNLAKGSEENERGDSTNLQVSARWQPLQNLSLNLDWSQTESYGAVTSGFYGGAYGYGGYSPYMGGYRGGLYSLTERIAEDDDEISQYTDSTARLGLSWQPLSTVSLDANLGLRKYSSGGSVGYLADSDQRYGNLSVSWLPNESLALNVSVGSDLLQFLDPGRGGVLNNSFMLSANYRPLNSKWSYGLSINKQWGVSPDYTGNDDVAVLVDTNLFDVSANVEYRLAKRARLTSRFGISDFRGGYADFMKNTAELVLQYQLSDQVALNFGWQFIKNNSRLEGSGTSEYTIGGEDYTTHLMLLSLSTNFHSSMGTTPRAGAGLNEPIRPGYGSFGYGGMGYGSGFMGGLELEREGGSFSSSFASGSYSSPLSGSGFARSYGTYGSFGRIGYGTSSYGSAGYLGSYTGFSGFGSGYSQYGSGYSSLGTGSTRMGSTRAFDDYGTYGDYNEYGDYPSTATEFGEPRWAPGFGGPLAPIATPRANPAVPTVGDPWAEAGTGAYPIDDLRDV